MDNRLVVDAILWIAGHASHWRDLLEVFGKWTAVHARFRRWSHAGVWKRFFFAPANTPDFEYPDQQHDLESPRRCDGRKGGEAAAIARSRGGLTTKLHAAVDALGVPLRIHPTPGQLRIAHKLRLFSAA